MVLLLSAVAVTVVAIARIRVGVARSWRRLFSLRCRLGFFAGWRRLRFFSGWWWLGAIAAGTVAGRRFLIVVLWRGIVVRHRVLLFALVMGPHIVGLSPHAKIVSRKPSPSE
jgi:hypothetical protein